MDNKKENEDSEAVEKTLEEDLPKIDLSKKVDFTKRKIEINTLEQPSSEELKQQIEALLFASARRVPANEIARVCNVNINEVKKAVRAKEIGTYGESRSPAGPNLEDSENNIALSSAWIM